MMIVIYFYSISCLINLADYGFTIIILLGCIKYAASFFLANDTYNMLQFNAKVVFILYTVQRKKLGGLLSTLYLYIQALLWGLFGPKSCLGPYSTIFFITVLPLCEITKKEYILSKPPRHV